MWPYTAARKPTISRTTHEKAPASLPQRQKPWHQSRANDINADDYSAPAVLDSTFDGNSAYTGAGIFSASATVPGTRFESNRASYGGAAIWGWEDSTMAISDSTFDGNSASWGGAVSGDIDSAVAVFKSTFRSNSAANSGGAVYGWADSTAATSNSTFDDNHEGSEVRSTEMQIQP